MHNINEIIHQNDILSALFNAIPCHVYVVDKNYKVQAINSYVEKDQNISANKLNSQSMGGVLRCVNAQNDGACGRTDSCNKCQLLNAAQKILNGEEIFRNRASIRIDKNGNSEDIIMLISAALTYYKGDKYAIVLMEDITELSTLRLQAKTQYGFSGLIGRDAKMLQLFETIEELALVDVPVMIQGESGTGKELVATAIHKEGLRRNKPFIAVNCGALPDTLLESELFGHVKGAFTGAIRDKKGRFELAHGGTIFLDEINDISPMMQVKLLRVLQEGTFEKVGSETTTKVDVRVISASNKSIIKEIAAKRFREDLFYRLCVVPLNIPPLRERNDDILLLAKHFLEETLISMGRKSVVFSLDALKIMQNYYWPGNIRELQNVIHYTLVKCKGQVIEVEHLPASLLDNQTPQVHSIKRKRKGKLNLSSVQEALNKSGGSKVKTARILGVSRATLYRFLDDHGIKA